jgi:PAS domain S-box-containing protein
MNGFAISVDEARVIDSLASSPLAMVLSNPRKTDNPLEVVNQAFCDLTGYTEQEVVGHNCRFLSGIDTEPSATEQLRSAIRSAEPTLTEILNYRRDGTAFRNGVMITPLRNTDGDLAWFLGSQVDLGPSDPQALRKRRTSAAERIRSLSPRQRQVLQAMSRGLLNKQIAWELKIAEKTVKMHRALMIDRLGVASSAEAIRIAVESGL